MQNRLQIQQERADDDRSLWTKFRENAGTIASYAYGIGGCGTIVKSLYENQWDVLAAASNWETYISLFVFASAGILLKDGKSSLALFNSFIIGSVSKVAIMVAHALDGNFSSFWTTALDSTTTIKVSENALMDEEEKREIGEEKRLENNVVYGPFLKMRKGIGSVIQKTANLFSSDKQESDQTNDTALSQFKENARDFLDNYPHLPPMLVSASIKATVISANFAEGANFYGLIYCIWVMGSLLIGISKQEESVDPELRTGTLKPELN